ncbi:hypothetical protein ACFQMH_07845 [Streptomyces viridiviolaceus]|uniref:Uncharacterized protein n=1 Tax=Streptomyces viridiviolaceus TaxID=68282 RepID=A0ABW2DZ95_9ACTN|nr:hypothetical protein [Streptomyces viridiviolaceus]
MLTWELVPRLGPREVATVMAAFHPLWEGVSGDDVVWVDEHVGHGNFRTWAKLSPDRGDLWQKPGGGGPPVAGAGLRTAHGAAVTGASGPGEAGGHEDGPHARGGLPSSSLPALRGPAVRRLLRSLLALWKGNVAAVHRELTARAARQSPPAAPPPSLPTLHRAIQRDLTPGE